jgi:DNA-binding ferritin-like protein (Dps family)
MKIETVKYLWASDGMWLTDGKIYAKVLKLAENRSADEFHEITDEEYNTILATMTAEAEES